MRSFPAAAVVVTVASALSAPASAELAATVERLAPVSCFQVILVTSADWDTSSGTLRTFARSASGAWEPAGPERPVRLGRHGSAWGRGLHASPPEDSGPVKREGDGKAPAGVFALGTAFGPADPPPGTHWPWRRTTSADRFVDDPESPFYNRWTTLPAGPPPWRSAESMRRDDALYDLGLVVRHNDDPVLPGAGSAIFIHVWKDAASPTSGCTALAREDLAALLAWLRPEARPVLIQCPLPALPHLRLPP